jgi:hypothetical protein
LSSVSAGIPRAQVERYAASDLRAGTADAVRSIILPR